MQAGFEVINIQRNPVKIKFLSINSEKYIKNGGVVFIEALPQNSFIGVATCSMWKKIQYWATEKHFSSLSLRFIFHQKIRLYQGNKYSQNWKEIEKNILVSRANI